MRGGHAISSLPLRTSAWAMRASLIARAGCFERPSPAATSSAQRCSVRVPTGRLVDSDRLRSSRRTLHRDIHRLVVRRAGPDRGILAARHGAGEGGGPACQWRHEHALAGCLPVIGMPPVGAWQLQLASSQGAWRGWRLLGPHPRSSWRLRFRARDLATVT